MEKLKMTSFSSDEIHSEISDMLVAIQPNFSNRSGDAIYDGTIFEDIHPENNPKTSLSKEAMIALNELIEKCEDADYVQIWTA